MLRINTDIVCICTNNNVLTLSSLCIQHHILRIRTDTITIMHVINLYLYVFDVYYII